MLNTSKFLCTLCLIQNLTFEKYICVGLASLTLLYPFIPLPKISVAVVKTNVEFYHRSFASGTLDKNSASHTLM